MEITMNLASRLALAAALGLGGAAQAANLVTNGSFEQPNIVGGGYVTYDTTKTDIVGWTILAPTPTEVVQLTPDTYAGLRGSEGRQWLDLTGIYGYDKGVRSASFATTVGATYEISFDVGNYVPFGFSTLGVRVNAGAEALFTNASLLVTHSPNMSWASKSFQWVADTTSTQLTFMGRANGSLSNNAVIGLDNVRMELVSAPVPEPSAYALMLIGLLAGFGLLHRRRVR
jgi:PEP-CTERM motif